VINEQKKDYTHVHFEEKMKCFITELKKWTKIIPKPTVILTVSVSPQNS
jgi:hypothetical protein